MIKAVARIAVRWWWAVIAVWVAVAASVTLLAPSFTAVATYGEGAFLPEDAPALRGGDLLAEGWPRDNFARNTAIGFVRDDRQLTTADRDYARAVVAWLESEAAPDAFGQITTHLRRPRLTGALTADDGHAMIVVAGLEIPVFGPRANRAIEDLRAHLDTTSPPRGLGVHVTGTAAVAADQSEAIDTSVNRAHLVTIALVVLILLYVYRSPVAPLVPLATIGTAYLTSLGIVSLLAGAGMDVSSLFQTFSIVVVFGAGTDYCLLLVSRYHEELALAGDRGYQRDTRLRHRTLLATTTALGGVIASSAATVIVGFSAQGVAEFGLFRTMGPAMAIAIAVTLTAGLTLTPALMRLFGRRLFWPDRATPTGHGDDDLLIEDQPEPVAVTARSA